MYEGKTGDKLQELGDPAHKGGIYGVRFSPNSQEILSVSGDKTAKIWIMIEYKKSNIKRVRAFL